jgi:hypothetical protein
MSRRKGANNLRYNPRAQINLAADKALLESAADLLRVLRYTKTALCIEQ